MSFAVHLAGDLEVVVGKHSPTLAAAEAPWMELLLDAAKSRRTGSLEVLPLDPAMTTIAERAVVLVVVLFAVRLVVDDIKVGSREGLMAGSTNEACLVPPAREPTVCSLD